MLKEFKEFAMKGNLVDIAVGFVMGAAFKEVVTTFTGGIVSPLIGLIFKADFKDLRYKLQDGTLNDAGEMVGEVYLEYGTFLTNVIDFIIVAFVMFMVVKAVNRMKKKEEPAPEAPSGPSDNELLLQIRDLLKKQ
ncbi:MAG: large conductance mechanosensitive channel protein MscL [Xanthomarina sp.]|uniref:large-conductance mechanosensitive channel protein MscL n=1 Tax=Xanthomarina TaxID=1868329 RepID=UPI000C392F80|nr:large-conductance mechanosensitive channel protein MscL [Xanthomarina sp.]MAL22382.1 large conductance mechanosensitive channel protein MscL [Xanthomarina sp.]MBF60947.1 large conductance mechanosensitive channel protein MscL [Xanthomarina sp.]HAB28462.1 large conductance mechanosensitive channel protein MscL [Xanthomarina gelatinilytica]HAI18954.1 large conductance mechanosensitive channel protein MscL [Xanthomarina gelatinilytica]|tara:strand:+ start:932 stop:1336 length:405 start_codon:yes stop_codon:yes gene_type:complete